METSLLDKQNTNDSINKYLLYKRKFTVNSIYSLPEYHNKLYLSKIIISLSFISLILGLYILFNGSFYFNPRYKFNQYLLLYYYTLIFTFGIFGLLFISFIVTLIIKLIKLIKNCFRNKSEDDYETLEEKEINLNEKISDNNILLNELENADNIAIIPYTLSICIFLSIILYLIGLPFSFYLIYILLRNNIYYKFFQFLVLYLFIIINDTSGAIFLLVLISFIKTKTQNSYRKMPFSFDEDNLTAAYKEVKDAINLAN